MKLKMHKLFRILLLFNVVAIFLNLSLVYKVYGSDDNNAYRLPVIETSDIHGYLVDKKEDDYRYLLSYISDKVKDLRGYGDNYRKEMALLLDGGDIYQGNVMSNILKGKQMSAAFKMMDYDAVTIGNHEFDWGIENTIDPDGTMIDSKLEGYNMVNDIPVVASNLYHNSKKVDWAKDYVIIPKKAINSKGEEVTVNIGVIGYLENYSSEIVNSQFAGKGYSIVEDLNIPNNIAKELEDKGLADVTILLCHKDAEEVAEKMPKDSAIDIVLGGHSHRNSCGRASNGMLYMQPENQSKAYNYFELIFKKDDKGKAIFTSIINMENRSVSKNLDKTTNIPENSDELDSELVALTDKVISKIKNITETKIGYIKNSATTDEYIKGSGNFSTSGGNWVSSIYARGVNSDVAFVNKTGVRYNFEIPEGNTKRDITVGDIYSNFPFDNRIYKYEITYGELLEVLNYAIKDDDRSFISSIVGIDCYYSDGKINSLLKDGTLIYHNGEWKDNWKNKKLTIATNEYVATTDEVFKGEFHNPLVKWNDSSRLIDKEKIDSECAIKVLTDEAKEKDGLLEIDLNAHYIEGIYQGQLKENEHGEKINSDSYSSENVYASSLSANIKAGTNSEFLIAIIVLNASGLIGIIVFRKNKTIKNAYIF